MPGPGLSAAARPGPGSVALAELRHDGSSRASLEWCAPRPAQGADNHAVACVAFTDPHVAAVGLTEAQARAAGVAVKVLSVPLGSVAATALLGRDIDGVAQLVVDEPRRTIVGATFVGPMAGALLHAAKPSRVSDPFRSNILISCIRFSTVPPNCRPLSVG